MLWREYNEEETMAHWKEDFYEEGEQHGLEVGRANGEKIKLIKLVCKKLVKINPLKRLLMIWKKMYQLLRKFAMLQVNSHLSMMLIL